MRELKRYEIDPDYPNDIVGGSYYDADEVDTVIAELKYENRKLKERKSPDVADARTPDRLTSIKYERKQNEEGNNIQRPDVDSRG